MTTHRPVIATQLAAMLTVGLVSFSSVSATEPTYPCYWVNGRLMAYNGNPSYRIWPKGTKRILGVTSPGDTWIQDRERLPTKVRRLNPTFQRHIWGEFYVCPKDRERAGWMRLVVLKDARRMSVIEQPRKLVK